MKGVIFKHFESFVSENFGAELFEEVLDSAELQTEGPFLGPGTYPDADLFALVGGVIERLGISLTDAVYAFGKDLFPRLAAGYPPFLEGAADLRSFLRTVDGVIHVEVRKLFPEAVTPSIVCEDTGADRLRVHYSSERKLCALFRGLLDGAAERFGERVELVEHTCQHEGAVECLFDLTFAGAAEEAA